MGFVFRLEDYGRYCERVGEATYVDITRRTDPACISRVWANLESVVNTYGSPWIVQLWTKHLSGALEKGSGLLERLRKHGTTLTAQMTVTGLHGTKWEPDNTASPFAGAEEFFELAGGPDHVKWRYDPIIPDVHMDQRFERLAERAAELGIGQCVINFIVPPGRYKRVDARLGGELPGWGDDMPGYDDAWRAATAERLLEIAKDFNITLAVCAESSRLSEQLPMLHPAACGDRAWFERLSGRKPDVVKGRGSRKGCGCAPYFDVGLYGQWNRCHRCLYCYAG